MLLFNETVNGQAQLRYAVQAEGQAALAGVSGLTLSAQRLQVSINRSGAAIDRSIATPTGWLQLAQRDSETRIRGYGTVGVGDWFSAEGDVFLESRQNQTVTLSDGSSATVNMLMVGGSGLSASVNAGASLALSGVDLALALSTETGSSTRRWLTSTATLTGASIDAAAQATVQMGMLDINRQLTSTGALYDANDEKVINWRPAADSAGLPLVINDTTALVLDTQASRLATAIQGQLSIGGASISGIFHVVRIPASGQSQPAWAVLASNASVALQANGASAQIENVTGNLLIAADGVSATHRGPVPPEPALEPDIRLAGLKPAAEPHRITARVRADGDDLVVLAWD